MLDKLKKFELINKLNCLCNCIDDRWINLTTNQIEEIEKQSK